jgi:hypothetical protein
MYLQITFCFPVIQEILKNYPEMVKECYLETKYEAPKYDIEFG